MPAPDLMTAARAAAERAHSPYSGVRVGAALLAADGRVFTGCNVENASYGLTMCAERVALGAAVDAGATAFEAIAVWSSLERLLMPCGACRQVLAEFAPSLRVTVGGAAGDEVLERTLDQLLPDAMGPGDLGS